MTEKAADISRIVFLTTVIVGLLALVIKTAHFIGLSYQWILIGGALLPILNHWVHGQRWFSRPGIALSFRGLATVGVVVFVVALTWRFDTVGKENRWRESISSELAWMFYYDHYRLGSLDHKGTSMVRELDFFDAENARRSKDEIAQVISGLRQEQTLSIVQSWINMLVGLRAEIDDAEARAKLNDVIADLTLLRDEIRAKEP